MIVSAQKRDQQSHIQMRDHLYTKYRETNKNNIDKFLDPKVIFGQGRLTKEISHFAISLICTYINYMKDQMTLVQLKRSIQLIIWNMLNPLTVFSLKNTLIYILYKLHEEVLTKFQNENQTYGDASIQMEIFESIVLVYEDLNKRLRIFVNEEGENLRKSKLKQSPP